MSRHTPPPDEATQLLIVADYRAGSERHPLARKYRTTAYHVTECLKRHGVPIRSKGEVTAARNRRRAATIDEAELLRLVDEKLSTTEIANRLGLTQPTVEMKLRRMGVGSKHGRGSKMEKNYFWRGGRVVDEDGYVLLKCPDHPQATAAGYVREHRLVMEQILGRYLTATEVVHHKNKNKADNHPDNLELFDTNGNHLRHELTGRTPNYSPEGRQRMRENALRLNHRRYGSSLQELETDALPSPSLDGPLPS